MQRFWVKAGFIAAVTAATATTLFSRQETLAKPSSKTITALSNRMQLSNISGKKDSQHLYRINVPAGASNLVFTTYGGNNARPVNLYVKFETPPTPTSFDAKDIGSAGVKLIPVYAPHAGVYYVLIQGANGSYSDQSLVASYAPANEVFKTGMHAHRLYNGGDWSNPVSPAPQFNYGLIRDWDISRLHDAVVWKPDGSIDFALIERVYAGHAQNGAKVIKTFGSVPTWASKRPAEPNPQYPNWPGAKSGPLDLDRYEDYVFRFVSRTRRHLWAVEGWNEPYSCPDDGKTEFTTMTPTELADVQKRVYRASKRADPRLLVLSPAQAYVCGIPTLLNARTSQGEPISKFFDVLAWHAYNRSARGEALANYAAEIMQVRRYLAQAGLERMPIADTEHGWLAAPKEGGKEFYGMSDAQKAQVLYETAQLAKSLGVLAVVWYGYDNEMIGQPMSSPVISDGLQKIYNELNTPRRLVTAEVHGQ